MARVRENRLYVLKSVHPKKGPQVQHFLHGEKDLAMHIAKKHLARGRKPFLFSKTYDGVFKVWLDWRKAKVRKLPERKLPLAA